MVFNTTQSDIKHLNGQKIIEKKPLDKSKYDSEVGAMWVIRLESGECLECFDDEIV